MSTLAILSSPHASGCTKKLTLVAPCTALRRGVADGGIGGREGERVGGRVGEREGGRGGFVLFFSHAFSQHVVRRHVRHRFSDIHDFIKRFLGLASTGAL